LKQANIGVHEINLVDGKNIGGQQKATASGMASNEQRAWEGIKCLKKFKKLGYKSIQVSHI
jgi:hypothetical protein